jgi:glutamine amidotransferase
MKIAIVDYGMGNIGSICNMLKHVGASFVVSGDRCEIAACDKIVLPGVGNFDHAMQNLSRYGLVELLHELVLERKKPILGICLGMQLMCHSSEEGKARGLGFVDAQVIKFAAHSQTGLKVPHMGWSEVEFQNINTLSGGLGDMARFYFVHSYYVKCNDTADVWGTTRYGEEIVAAYVRENIAGVQFHPEKSHKYGIQLFRNFVDRFDV